MTREIVYATSTTHVSGPDGGTVLIRHGSHWYSDDPVVKCNQSMFSPDPRFGLNWSGEPPAEMALPPDVPVEQATAAPGERRPIKRG